MTSPPRASRFALALDEVVELSSSSASSSPLRFPVGPAPLIWNPLKLPVPPRKNLSLMYVGFSQALVPQGSNNPPLSRSSSDVSSCLKIVSGVSDTTSTSSLTNLVSLGSKPIPLTSVVIWKAKPFDIIPTTSLPSRSIVCLIDDFIEWPACCKTSLDAKISLLPPPPPDLRSIWLPQNSSLQASSYPILCFPSGLNQSAPSPVLFSE
mmetsp:Transcript_9390/g.17530  ORF Transcript_9390/g.17530 Transcript_9390/m.17530 type:complete len:208 (-) Transcript_9390:641-1264(-)